MPIDIGSPANIGSLRSAIQENIITVKTFRGLSWILEKMFSVLRFCDFINGD